MKIYLGGLIGLALIVGFTSCQREVDESLSNRTQNDSVYVSKQVIIDTTKPSGMDTLLLSLFEYDASKRFTKLAHFYFKAGTAMREAERDYYFKYNGADTFPSSLIHEYKDFGTASMSRDTAYYFYQSGALVKDSAIELNGWYVNSYTKLTSNRYRVNKLLVGLPAVFTDTCYSYINWQNGNLLSEIDSEYLFQPPALANVAHNQVTYDNKINPLRKLFIPYPVALYPEIMYNQYLAQYLITPSANNVLSWVDDSGSYSCTYKYNSNDMPSEVKVSDGLSAQKFIYYYIRI